MQKVSKIKVQHFGKVDEIIDGSPLKYKLQPGVFKLSSTEIVRHLYNVKAAGIPCLLHNVIWQKKGQHKLMESTFVFLQATDLFEDRLQVHVEPMAVAEQLQEVTRTNRTACVVDEFTCRGQTIRKDFKLLPLRQQKEKTINKDSV